MEIIKISIELIFSPLGILTVLTACGLGLSVARKHRRAGGRLLFVGGLLFLVFLISPLADYLVLQLESPYPPMLKPPEFPKIDRIVVLAGYGRDYPGFPITSNLSSHTICNAVEGLRLYRLVPGAKLILSGGIVRKGDRPVSAMMADFLQQMGVPASDLIVEGSSRNTYENLLEVKKIVNSNPFILIAAGCDLRRATAVARKLKMTAIPAPACIWALQRHSQRGSAGEKMVSFFRGFAPSAENLSRLQWAYHEYVGYIWYGLLGRI